MRSILLLPLLSALLLWASFPPLDLGFLGWVALVPLMVYARRETRSRRAFFVAWLSGALWILSSLLWLSHTVPAGPYLLGLYMGLYVALYVAGLRLSTVRFPLPFVAPFLWVALEYVRGYLFGGFPSLLLGYAPHGMFHLIQIADLGGVWLISWLVVFVNAVLAETICASGDSAQPRRILRSWGLVAAGLVIASSIYGVVRVHGLEVREGPDIACVQPNIRQSLKMLMRYDPNQTVRNFEKHGELTSTLRGDRAPDLVVWPEAALYRALYCDGATGRFFPESLWHDRVTEVTRRAGMPILLGCEVVEVRPGWKWGDARDGEGERSFNSAILVDPSRGIVGRYDKTRLVQFAEYIPFTQAFPWIRTLVKKYSGLALLDMMPGQRHPIFEAGGVPYGVVICSENVYPEIPREIARKGGRFAVNISNEGWFKRSPELDQMQAMARFRAIESRLGYVRGTNTGISSFFSPTGELDAVLEVGGRRKRVEGILRHRVRYVETGSLYRVVGDVVPWTGLAVSVLVLTAALFFRSRR